MDRPIGPRDAPEHLTLLRERFTELGVSARRFLDGLLRDQRCGKNQARRVLALLGSYSRNDWLAALERAVRYGAYSADAVERILAGPGQAQECFANPGRRGEPSSGTAAGRACAAAQHRRISAPL